MTEQPQSGPDDPDAAIARATARWRERARLVARRDALDGTLAAHAREVAALDLSARQEQSQVEALEGLTLDRVLAALRGSRADDLDRERAEAQAAAYRLAAATARHEGLQAERAQLADRLAALSGVDAEREDALAAKDAFLQGRPEDPRAGELARIAAERGGIDDALREVDEAVVAGAAAERAVGEVAELLGSAGNWSTYDTWFGGGLIGSVVKHDRLDQAQRAAARAEQQLDRLGRELADVGGGTEVAPALGIGGATRFLDIWFDNVFTDLAVAGRIRDAQRTAADAARNVARVLDGLRTRRTELGERREALIRRRDELLGADG